MEERSSLVDRVRAAFAALPAHGIVTLVGPGGIGKSVIARAAAGPDATVVALADAERLPADLTGASLVLDDADRVLDDVARLFATAPRRLLVTSREPVGVAAEVVVAIPPLALDEAVAMLRPSAPDAPDDDLRVLAERVERVPLALALAAARLRLVGPRELAERLDEGLGGLASERRDLPARHASMEACVAWSWERLDAPLRAALAAVAAFERPVTLEDFEASLPGEDPIALADRLLARSLLRRTDPSGPATLDLARYVRAFVRSRALPTRHADVVLAKLESAAARVYGREASAALDALAALVPDALRAFATTIDGAPGTAARIALALSDVVVVRHVIDARGDLLARAVAAADASGDRSLRVRLRVLAAKADLELGRPLDARVRLGEALAMGEAPRDIAEAKRSLGWANIALGDGDAATRAFDEAVATTIDLGDVRGRADATAGRGLARCLLGRLAEGHADLETAHALHVASGDALRRDKVADMARLTGLELAAGDEPDLRASADAHRAGGRLWRAALDLVWLAHRAVGTERAALYDEARRTALEAGVRPDLAAALDPGAKEPRAWRVGPEARWIEKPEAVDGRIDLARHGSLRLVLEGLVAARLATPGRAISADGLLEAGWPGEKVRYESGMLRVYTAIRRLRKLGLDELLVTRDDGYLLRPDVPLERSS